MIIPRTIPLLVLALTLAATDALAQRHAQVEAEDRTVWTSLDQVVWIDDAGTIAQGDSVQGRDASSSNLAPNVVSINQPGTSSSSIIQTGSRHFIYILQQGTGANTINIAQHGSSHHTEIRQVTDVAVSDRLVVGVTQEGAIHRAFVYQSAVVAEAYISQEGHNHIAHVEQTNAAPGVLKATIDQDGTSQFAHVRQTGPATLDNDVVIQQSNFANTARVQQSGSGGHDAEITQGGSHNRVEGLAGTGSFMLQTGEGHTLDVTQSGTQNVLRLLQSGTGHEAAIDQAGSGREATIEQHGANHTATITQGGSVFTTTLASPAASTQQTSTIRSR